MNRIRLGMATGILLLAAAPVLAADEARQPGIFGTPPEALVTALTTLAIFLVLVALLGKYAWGPIASGLKAREDKIRKDIADAEEARRKAEATLREYSQRLAAAEDRVRELLTKAAADGEQLATSIRMKAQQEAEEIKERTIKDLEAAKDSAILELKEFAADLAVMGAEKILRRNLNAEDQRQILRSGLDELETIKA